MLLHSLLIQDSLLVGVKWQQKHVMQSAIKQRSSLHEYRERQSLLFFICFPLLSHLWQRVCQKEERRRVCFRTETLYDSCFLRFDLGAVHSPGINHFRLSKQFPITVSIFRVLRGGEGLAC